MKRIAALLILAGCAVVMGQVPADHTHQISANDELGGMYVAHPCDEVCITQRNVATLNRDSVMLERAFESIKLQESCKYGNFSWTFPKGVDPVRSAGFKFNKNRDGSITAWRVCGKTKRGEKS